MPRVVIGGDVVPQGRALRCRATQGEADTHMDRPSKVRTAWAMARACLRGWRSRQRILVLESDDWGAIRTASREARQRLVAAGYPMERSKYGLDALETEEDLDLLFETLEGVRDARGRAACMTANIIMANPDFRRIRDSDFRECYFEPVEVTLSHSEERRGVVQRWRLGEQRGCFVAQLHGNVHIRWWEWLRALQGDSRETRLTFDLGMCGVPMAVSREGLGFYNSPFVAEDVLRRNGIDLEADVRDGVLCFQRLLGRRPVGGCAPCYCWTDRVEALWRQAGIRYIQTRLFQDVGGAGWRSHYLGERSVAGGVYLLRNCSFEPAGEGSRALVRCLRGVARAFRLGKPAIICSHRVNFIGAIDPANRETGLRLLGELLRTVRNRWPDVHFLSSAELGGTIEQDMEQACRARRRPPP